MLPETFSILVYAIMCILFIAFIFVFTDLVLIMILIGAKKKASKLKKEFEDIEKRFEILKTKLLIEESDKSIENKKGEDG